MVNLSTLPPEIIRIILENLPVRSFLAFGLTSKNNHAIQSHSLSSLRLGVSQSRLNGMVCVLEGTLVKCYTHTFQAVLSKTQSRNRKMVVRNQNAIIRVIVSQYCHTLRDLEISLWELQEPVAKSIARVKNLRGLSIRLGHPNTGFLDVGRSFWEISPGSTVWNDLFAKSDQLQVPGRLQSLNLEGAGITDYQLEQLMNNHPMIRDLRLQKCLNLTTETFHCLARNNEGRPLKTLYFTEYHGKKIDNRILEYIGKLTNLDVSETSSARFFDVLTMLPQFLSLHECTSIDSEIVLWMNERLWQIPKLVLPRTQAIHKQAIGIDPYYS